tara:strand:+ start:211 stop:708 length:498 start_codon:yes stop_codon:yes gene_type:complete
MLLVKKIILISFFLLYTGCYTNFDNKPNDEEYSLRYHLGTATSAQFQKSVQEVIVLYGYSVKEYSSYGNYQIADTYWKNRDLYPAESDKGFVEAKTKLLFTASNDRLDSFEYDANLFSCYLDIRNKCFDGDRWIDYKDGAEFQSSLDSIVAEIKNEFLMGMQKKI